MKRTRNIEITKEHLIQDFLDLEGKLGHLPKCYEFVEKHHCLGAVKGRFGSWRSFITAMGKTPLRSEVLSKECLTKNFSKMEQEFGRQPKYKEFRRKQHNHQYSVLFHFGGWKKFLDAMGKKTVGITKEHLIKDFLYLESVLDRQPTFTEFAKMHHSIYIVVKHFKSWSGFLEAVGRPVMIRREPGTISKKHIISDYRALESKLGRQPTCTEFTKWHHTLNVVGIHFGSWNEFVVSMGGIPLRTTQGEKVTRDHLIQDFIELEKGLGREPEDKDFWRHKHSACTVRSRFGSWEGFRKALGKGPVIKTKVGRLTKEHLIQDFLDQEKELGRQPTVKEFCAKHHAIGTIWNLFGRWNEFVQAMGKTPLRKLPEKPLTKEHLIQDFLDLEAKLKRTPMQREFKAKHHAQGSVTARFGGWKGFVKTIQKENRIGV